METFRQLKPPELWSCSSTPSARRRRLKLKKGQWSPELCGGSETEATVVKGKNLKPPAIEVTPSSEDDAWSNCSTPSASPKRRRGLLKKWLSRKEGGGGGCVSSQLSHLSDRGTSQNIPTALFIISIVLLVLVVLNMMLFYRLWSLEHTARTFQTWQSYAVSQG
ncbi:hypothetical protein GDO81_014681 [Engystomops pustulosus]|uniref:Uncharacterized protein n=1 Tax=Engystomops pustulosus TaxID=76066 RepID=A0AAV7BC61_ENGPU|nr:hypothetical protein GDO81_014681 [Engystomops pustulosus]KAG8570075.1 hypothetical protein GDO81_014681 [Engystomops pustulosus]